MEKTIWASRAALAMQPAVPLACLTLRKGKRLENDEQEAKELLRLVEGGCAAVDVAYGAAGQKLDPKGPRTPAAIDTLVVLWRHKAALDHLLGSTHEAEAMLEETLLDLTDGRFPDHVLRETKELMPLL